MYFQSRHVYVKATKRDDGKWNVLDSEDVVTILNDEDFEDMYEAVT